MEECEGEREHSVRKLRFLFLRAVKGEREHSARQLSFLFLRAVKGEREYSAKAAKFSVFVFVFVLFCFVFEVIGAKVEREHSARQLSFPF